MGWDTWPHTREVMTWIISEASDKSCCSERSRWVVMMETLHLALRWITQSGSTWLIRLHSNDQPTRSSVAWTRGHVYTWLTGGRRCQAAHQIWRIWEGGSWVHVLARGPLSVGVNLRSGGKLNPLQCTRRHFHVGWRLEQKRFIAGESITAERCGERFKKIKEHNKVLLFSELLCEPWGRQQYWAILCLFRSTLARH